MASLVGLAIGLGLVFGCLMLALAAEFYYLLCRRNRRRAPNPDVEKQGDVSSTDALKQKPAVLNGGAAIPTAAVSEFGIEDSTSISGEEEEMGLDSELMKLHGLAGPPRFLFTIKEESREDLAESDDGRSGKGSRSRARSLSDLDFEFGFPVKSSSPPPKFKFLRDAEEKFYWKQRVERPSAQIMAPY